MNRCLEQISQALDASILSVIGTPELAGGTPLLEAEALCREITKTFGGGQGGTGAQTALLWDIRSRLGRLKLLLDSADAFYRGLSSPLLGTVYDVHGEWKERSMGNLLRLDC